VSEVEPVLERGLLAGGVGQRNVDTVLIPHFEEKYPEDDLPQKEIQAGRAWARGQMLICTAASSFASFSVRLDNAASER
jgi:hypothetical protein